MLSKNHGRCCELGHSFTPKVWGQIGDTRNVANTFGDALGLSSLSWAVGILCGSAFLGILLRKHVGCRGIALNRETAHRVGWSAQQLGSYPAPLHSRRTSCSTGSNRLRDIRKSECQRRELSFPGPGWTPTLGFQAVSITTVTCPFM